METKGKRLVLRADAGAEIGTGHVMRCLALAQAWQDAGGSAVFAQQACPEGLALRLQDEGLPTEAVRSTPGTFADAASTGAIARRLGAEWVVVDGYTFGSRYQELLRSRGLRVLFLDDYGHADPYTADIVLNQNITATPELYARRTPHTALLLGTEFVMLRREFLPWRGHGARRRVYESGRRLLVTLGGSDVHDTTSIVLQAIEKLPMTGLDVTVLLGDATPNARRVHALAAKLGFVRVLRNVKDVPSLMARADVAVTAGGSTCWETAFMGLPGLNVVTAENQRKSARLFDAQGASQSLGWYAQVTPERLAREMAALLADADRRGKMARLGVELVDGMGAERVANALGSGSAVSSDLSGAES